MGLTKYSKSIHAVQGGEDGIIENIFRLIDVYEGKQGENGKLFPRFCCEFGAWDGIYLSNTRHLIESHGWGGLMIEGDRQKAMECVTNSEPFQGVTTACCMVAPVKGIETSYDNVLDKVYGDNVPHVDFLSIDVDGLDYEIFDTIEKHMPSVVCIETNPALDPTSMYRVPTARAQHNIGQSLAVMTDLFNKKGYELICFTGNAFYVKKELFPAFALEVPSNSLLDIYSEYWSMIETWRPGEDHKNYLRRWLREQAFSNPIMDQLG